MRIHPFGRSSGLDEPVFSGLKGLVTLWEQAGSGGGLSFFDEFFRELSAINWFQFHFPETPPVHLMGILRISVMNRLRDGCWETGEKAFPPVAGKLN